MMAAQQQVTGRRAHNTTTKMDASSIQGFEGRPASSQDSSPGHLEAASLAACGGEFHDSRVFLDYDDPKYEDFTLFGDGPPFIDDEDASMICNHGSTYNGTNNERASQIRKYTSCNDNDDQPVTAAGAIGQGVNEAVDQRPTPQDGPSLFANFQASSGPSPLLQWVMTDHRHEMNAYRFEQPPYPADRLQSPPPPPAKRRRTKSAKERRRRS